MRSIRRLAAFLSAAAIVSGGIAPAAAMAAVTSDISVSQEAVSATEDEVAAQMRGYIKGRTATFTVDTPQNGFANTDIGAHLIYRACEETGIGDEGDYLRYSIQKYSCRVRTVGDTYNIEYNINYYTSAEEEAALTNELKGIMDKLSVDGLSDYNKIRMMYKYATENVSYSKDVSDPYSYSAYNAVFNRNAVCQGIAQLLYRMYTDSGISCRIIAGVSKDNLNAANNGHHVWLIVKLNGSYYLMDPTWDMKYNGAYFSYFLKGTGDFDSAAPTVSHIAQNDNGLAFPDYNSASFAEEYPIAVKAYPEPKYSTGDVTGDSKVDAIDASLLLSEYARESAGKYPVFNSGQNYFADVNHDGAVNAVDASLVLSYYAEVSTGYSHSIETYVKSH